MELFFFFLENDDFKLDVIVIFFVKRRRRKENRSIRVVNYLVKKYMLSCNKVIGICIFYFR